MADVTVNPNSYAGEAFADLLTKMIVPKDGILDKGLVTPKPGVKTKGTLRTADIDIEFQDPSDVFNDDGLGATRGEKSFQVVAMEVHKQLSYIALYQAWEAAQMREGGNADYEGTDQLRDFYADIVAEKIGILHEEVILRGKDNVSAGTVSFSDDYPGLYPTMEADNTVPKISLKGISGASVALTAITTANPGIVTAAAHGLNDGDTVTIFATDGNQQVNGSPISGQSFQITVVDANSISLGVEVTGSTAATAGTIQFINEDNVKKVLTTVYRQIPRAVKKHKETKIIVHAIVAEAWELFQSNQTAWGGMSFEEEKAAKWLGKVITVMENVPENTVAVWNPRNVFLCYDGTGLDTNGTASGFQGTDPMAEDIEVIWMGDKTGDKVFRYRSRIKSWIDYVYGDEMLLCRPEA